MEKVKISKKNINKINNQYNKHIDKIDKNIEKEVKKYKKRKEERDALKKESKSLRPEIRMFNNSLYNNGKGFYHDIIIKSCYLTEELARLDLVLFDKNNIYSINNREELLAEKERLINEIKETEKRSEELRAFLQDFIAAYDNLGLKIKKYNIILKKSKKKVLKLEKYKYELINELSKINCIYNDNKKISKEKLNNYLKK